MHTRAALHERFLSIDNNGDKHVNYNFRHFGQGADYCRAWL